MSGSIHSDSTHNVQHNDPISTINTETDTTIAGSVGVECDNDLIIRHTGLVRRAAQYLSARLPSSVSMDDLIQAGMLGLVEAAQRFDASKGATFATFADRRVRGAMLDEVRKNAWAPRSLHRKAREVAAAVRQVESASGGEAREQDVIALMDMSADEYHHVIASLHGQKLMSIEELGTDSEDSSNYLVSPSPRPEEMTEQQHLLELLVNALDALPKREKLVLALYYDEHLNLKEIGSVLGVSESRVSQLHSQALKRLRTRLKH